MNKIKPSIKEKFKTSLIIILLIAIVFQGTNILVQEHHKPTIQANVYVFRESPSGNDLIYSGNVITDRLEAETRNALGFANATVGNYKYIALGNTTVSQTENKLDTEASTTGFDRVVGSSIVAWISSGDRAYNVTKKFTATGNIEINAAALHKSDVTDTEDAGAIASLGGQQAFQNNWNCTIVWVIVCNFN